MDERSIPPPLAGVRVLDLTHYIAGPFCTKLLAQLGADVLKVEPPGGEGGRGLKPFQGDVPHPELGGTHLYLNTGKRGITLDLKHPHGRDRLLQLIEQADVLVENFAPRVLPALGLGLPTLHARNRRLVVTSISNFGQSGPYRDYAATEVVSFAMGGLMDTIGFPEDPPIKFGGNPALYMAGIAGFTGTLAALRHAEASGEGQQVDVSVQECVASSHFQALAQYAYLGTVLKRNHVMMVFPCADGYVGCQIQAHHWPRFVELLGIPELGGLGSGSIVERQRNSELIETLILPWMVERPMAEIYRMGQEAGLPFSYFATVGDLFESPQYRERGFFVTIDHPEAGPITYPGIPYKMMGVPEIERRAPLLGEHNDNPEFLPREPRFDPPAPGMVTTAAGMASALPLDGVRVLDLGMFQSAPYCGRLLGDLGAEVIKVESGRRPDPLRVQARYIYPGGEPGKHPWNRSGMINERNRSKLALSLDLTGEAGKRCFRELAMISDIVIENFSSRVMANFGLDYEALVAINPGIILLSIGSQGRTGPERDFVSYGTTLEQTGGLISITGFPGKSPGFSGVAYPDSLAGVLCTGLIIAALRQRNLSGRGTHIDVSQRELTTAVIGEAVMEYTLNGRVPGPDGNRDANWAPQGVYRCTGIDQWVAIAAPDECGWRALCQVIDRLDLLDDPRYASADQRRLHHDLLDEAITAWTVKRDHYAAMHALQAAGVAAGAVLAVDQLFGDPHLEARSFFETVADTEAGENRYVSRPWKMTGTSLMTRRPAPLFGENTDEILRKHLGLSDDCITRLHAENVVATEPLPLVRGD